jgi:hypothetical protein
MPENRINVTLSAADRTAVMDAINTIRAKLPFLIPEPSGFEHELSGFRLEAPTLVAKACLSYKPPEEDGNSRRSATQVSTACLSREGRSCATETARLKQAVLTWTLAVAVADKRKPL